MTKRAVITRRQLLKGAAAAAAALAFPWYFYSRSAFAFYHSTGAPEVRPALARRRARGDPGTALAGCGKLIG
jgi:TAT (twin-arginine translocation) pathway signal sequence